MHRMTPALFLALRLAQAEAVRTRFEFVEPEHLLLGLFKLDADTRSGRKLGGQLSEEEARAASAEIANLLKLFDGGYVPVLIGIVMTVMMWTWKRGSKILENKTRRASTAPGTGNFVFFAHRIRLRFAMLTILRDFTGSDIPAVRNPNDAAATQQPTKQSHQ